MAKNDLVSVPADLADVYRVTGSNFPNVGGSGTGSKPGYDTLVTEATAEESPRDLEGDANGPSVWGKGGTAFKVGTSAGEGGGPASSMDMKFGVDCVNGDISPNVSTERT